VAAHTLDRSSSEIRRMQSRSQHGSVHLIQCLYGYRDGPTLSHTVQVNSVCITECASFLNLLYIFCLHYYYPCNEWVPVTTAWRVPRLRMEERPLIWRVAANILNKQSRTVLQLGGWSRC